MNDATLEIGPIFDVNTGVQIAPPGIYNPATRTITWFVGEVGSDQGGYTDFNVCARNDVADGTEIINYATIYFPSVPEETRTNGIVSIVSLNQPPVANAGSDQTVEVTSIAGAEVILDGSLSSDPDGSITEYDWTENGSLIARGTMPTVILSIGSHIITLTVTDDDGSAATDEVVINVQYSFGGILQPINADGNSIFKLGSTVPVKFQLRDAAGNFITSAVARLYLSKIDNAVEGSELEAVSTIAATTGNLFRYADNQYIFNLGTKSLTVGTWRLNIVLDDGTSRYVNISLRK